MPRWLDIPWLGGVESAPWVILATVLIVVAATIGSLYVSNRSDHLDYATRSYQIGPHSAELTFDVEKSPKAVAQCTVQALSLDSRVVGWKAGIVVGPNPPGRGTTTHTVVVPTSEEANVVEIENCSIIRKG
jgi:Domain of unknown function (DUF4307)